MLSPFSVCMSITLRLTNFNRNSSSFASDSNFHKPYGFAFVKFCRICKIHISFFFFLAGIRKYYWHIVPNSYCFEDKPRPFFLNWIFPKDPRTVQLIGFPFLPHHFFFGWAIRSEVDINISTSCCFSRLTQRLLLDKLRRIFLNWIFPRIRKQPSSLDFPFPPTAQHSSTQPYRKFLPWINSSMM